MNLAMSRCRVEKNEKSKYSWRQLAGNRSAWEINQVQSERAGTWGRRLDAGIRELNIFLVGSDESCLAPVFVS